MKKHKHSRDTNWRNAVLLNQRSAAERESDQYIAVLKFLTLLGISLFALGYLLLIN